MPSPRRQRKDVMLCYPYDAERLKQWDQPYIVQPKYDGIRALANVYRDEVRLVTGTGLAIETMPHIVEELKKLDLRIPTVFDGELYIHGNFAQTCSLVKRGFVDPNHTVVTYVVFDVVSNISNFFRVQTLDIFKRCRFIETAPHYMCYNHDDVTRHLITYHKAGYEGIVVRNASAGYIPKRTTNIMKWKPIRSDHYKIVGYKQEMDKDGNPKDSLGSLICQKDDDVFSVGSGLTQEQRERYWQNPDEMIGKIVHVQYQELTHYGIPRFPVLINVIDAED